MTSESLLPPSARKIPVSSTIHGDTRVDDYAWLRQKENPEVIAYLEAENAYTDSVMKPTEPLQQALYEEMLGRIQETDLSVPYHLGDYFYYSRTEQGKQYPILCRKRGSLGAGEEITLDLNVLAEGHSYLGLGAYVVSDNGHLLAYSIDVTGFREYTLHVKDLRRGELLPDRVEKVGSVLWAADNRTIFYTLEDSAKRPYRFYRHGLGSRQDNLLYEETDALYRIWAQRSRSRTYIFLTSSSSTTTEVRTLRSDRPGDPLQVVTPRETGHRYYLGHHGDQFYIRTDKDADRDARNFRIVRAPITDPRPGNWTEYIPHDPGITREGVELFVHHAVIPEREGGLEQLRVIDLRSGESHRVTFNEPAYSVFLDVNPEFSTTVARFRYQSFVTPSSVFDYDMDNRERVLLKQTPVLGGYDSSQYEAERLHAMTSDGTRVPISLVRRKDTSRDGSAPLLLYGYGSYGASMPVMFSSNRVSLLDRGWIYAVAHIRGGGEMGEDWRLAGKLKCKQNTFSDFITSAEHLVANHYTTPDRLAIQGGSAGGLLMGAVVNQRPELFRAAIVQVPFVDVLNTMLDESLPLTVGEYLEWGNPHEAEDYAYMKTYCPYTNLEAKAYPAMLVRASLNDSQVMYWEAAKYVARLRALKTDHNILLLKTNMGAGHGGPSGRYDALHEAAFDYAFLLFTVTPGSNTWPSSHTAP